MSDQQDGRNDETQAEPKDGQKAGPQAGTNAETGPDAAAEAPLSGRTREAPVIEGAAVDATPPSESAATENKAPEAKQPAAAPPAKKSPLPPIAALLGLAVVAGAGYYGWTEVSTPARPPVILAPPPHVEAAMPPVLPEPAPAPTEPAPPEPVKAAEAPPPVPPPEPVIEKKIEAVAPPPEEAPKKAVTDSEPPRAAESVTDKALAQVTEQLAATRAALDAVTQRLHTVETQLAAPKNDARVTLMSPDSAPDRAKDASARLAVAQSLLSALRQGEDYAPQLAALSSLDPGSPRLARLRAGLTAPSAPRLAAEFVALAPKIAAAAAPPPPAREAQPARNFGENVLNFLETRAEKLVRVRPAGAPDSDEAAVHIDRIQQKLARGDIAGALAERALLPPPALAVSADWARGAQARLDAEEAARAELADALQGLSKGKS